jgi:hypothetical protein
MAFILRNYYTYTKMIFILGASGDADENEQAPPPTQSGGGRRKTTKGRVLRYLIALHIKNNVYS